MCLKKGANANTPKKAHRSKFNGGFKQPKGHKILFDLLVEKKSNSDALFLDKMSFAIGPCILASHIVDVFAPLQDLEIIDANVALEDFGAIEIIDVSDVNMVLKDYGKAKATCEDDADMVLVDSIMEVVLVDDADITLIDFGTSKTMHINVPSRIGHVRIL
jgi:hypothetical protein